MSKPRMIRAKAAALCAQFEAKGAQPVETPILQPAETLLDLYGEDIRARAYVTSDALRGEQMLRPDFTVPVVQMHMAEGAEPARYTYAGEVFRRQEDDPTRANEYVQVGYEVFDRHNPVQSDAEVFATIRDALGDLPLRAATGDIGILRAAIDGLNAPETRKAALRRHLWHPRRFRSLLDRFSGEKTLSAARLAMLSGYVPEAFQAPHIGIRTGADVQDRIAKLQADAAADPISKRDVSLMDALLQIRETLPNAIEQLRDIAVDLPAISQAVEHLAARMQKLAALGVDVAALDFEASYGRTSMEYYDGFVFGFYAEARPDLPAVATGGRYDALTRVLGQGQEIPAVGGVIRPGLMIELEDAA